MSNTKSKRIRQSADQWSQVISDQRGSPLCQVEFRKREGIALSTFARWRQRLSGADEPTPCDEPWIPAAIRYRSRPSITALFGRLPAGSRQAVFLIWERVLQRVGSKAVDRLAEVLEKRKASHCVIE